MSKKRKLTVLSEFSKIGIDVDDFEKHAAEAADIRQSSEQNPFAGYQPGVTSGGFQDFAWSHGHQSLTGFPTNNGTTFESGFVSPDIAFDDPFSISGPVTHGLPVHGISRDMQGLDVGFNNGDTNVSGGRARSTRKASVQATDGVAALLRHQKEEDIAEGERSSGEDSQTSEYHDLDEKSI